MQAKEPSPNKERRTRVGRVKSYNVLDDKSMEYTSLTITACAFIVLDLLGSRFLASVFDIRLWLLWCPRANKLKYWILIIIIKHIFVLDNKLLRWIASFWSWIACFSRSITGFWRWITYFALDNASSAFALDSTFSRWTTCFRAWEHAFALGYIHLFAS